MHNIIVLSIVSLLSDISTEMVYPLIPAFLMLSMGSAPLALGIIEGVAESFGNLLKFFFGIYSDKLKNRKRFAFLGYATAALGKVILATANNAGIVFLSRFVDRSGKGIRTAPRDAILAESTPKGKEGATFGFHRTFDTLGAVIGILIAYFAIRNDPSRDSIKFVFSLALIPACLSFLLVEFGVKEKINTKGKETARKLKDIYQGLKELPSQLKKFYLFIFIFALGNSSNLFLIMKSIDKGLDTKQALGLYLLYNITYCFFLYPASRLSDKFGRKWFLIIGYLIYGSVYLGFAMIDNVSFYWMLFAIYGLHLGLTEGVEKAFVSEYAPSGLKASALGIHATVTGVTILPASAFAGFLWQFVSPGAPFYFSAVTSIIAAFLIYKHLHLKKA